MTGAQSAETADVRGLLGAAYVYLNQFVPVDEARVNGFDVLAWCDAVDRLRCEGPLEGGDVWGPRHGTPHGASPPSSGPMEPEASYQREAEQGAFGGDVTAQEPEPMLVRVSLVLCALCLAGEGGECHVPGCALWMNRAPDVPIRDKCDSFVPLTMEGTA